MSQQKPDLSKFGTDGSLNNQQDGLSSRDGVSRDGAVPATSSSPSSSTAHKATFYMKPETIEALEELWMTVRKRVGPAARASITKSLLVETALKLLIDELKDSDRSETLRKLEITAGA